MHGANMKIEEGCVFCEKGSEFLYMTYFTVMLQMVVGMQFNVLVIHNKNSLEEGFFIPCIL